MHIIGIIIAGLISVSIFLSGLFIAPTILPDTPDPAGQFETIVEEDIPPLLPPEEKEAPSDLGQEPASPEKPEELPSQEPSEPPPVVSTTTEPTVATTSPQEPQTLSEDQLNEVTRSAIVNIFCNADTKTGNRSVTASGVFIDSRGIVLTNAHVAYLLLYGPERVSCQVRSGAPAEFLYTPRLLYLSSSWIHENREELSEENPKGTGEHDYALLIPTEPLEQPQSYLPLGQTDDLSPGAEAFLGSYPAGFLGSGIIRRGLYPATAQTTIEELFTFEGQTIDLAQLSSTILAQKGSSGGAVVSAYGNLLGLIVTTTEGETTEQRNLHGVLIGHINRSLNQELGEGLESYIDGDIWLKAEVFQQAIAPALRSFLETE